MPKDLTSGMVQKWTWQSRSRGSPLHPFAPQPVLPVRLSTVCFASALPLLDVTGHQSTFKHNRLVKWYCHMPSLQAYVFHSVRLMLFGPSYNPVDLVTAGFDRLRPSPTEHSCRQTKDNRRHSRSRTQPKVSNPSMPDSCVVSLSLCFH